MSPRCCRVPVPAGTVPFPPGPSGAAKGELSSGRSWGPLRRGQGTVAPGWTPVLVPPCWGRDGDTPPGATSVGRPWVPHGHVPESHGGELGGLSLSAMGLGQI